MSSIYKRVPHILKQPKKVTCPENLLFFDTETKTQYINDKYRTERLTLDFGYVLAGHYNKGVLASQRWVRFNTIVDFWTIVKSRLLQNRPLYCFAHNIGFDATIVGLWEHETKLGIDFKIVVDDSPPTFMVCELNGHKIVFIDTLNYWRVPLWKLGETLGLPKLEIDLKTASKKEKNIYCQRDVEIIMKAITTLMDYLRQKDLGTFAFTQAALALKIYKHRFMKHEIFIHDNMNICKMERDSYYGGRVECFYVGKVSNRKIYKLDINSMYPYVMLNKYPCKLIDYEPLPRLQEVRWRLLKHGAIATVDLDTPNEVFPYLYNKRLCFPLGKYHTTLAGPELERALALNVVTCIHSISWYEMKPLFKDFVMYFWNERLKAKARNDSVSDMFNKILLNSLYGKWAQRGVEFMELTPDTLEIFYDLIGKRMPKRYQKQSNLEIPIEKNGRWFPEGLEHPVSIKRTVNKLRIKVSLPEHFESFPAISSYCTSYAREYLLKLIKIAGENNYYYCDTDSLFVNNRGFERLLKDGKIDNKRMGALKIEGVESYAVFRSLKDYLFGTQRVTKGIRKDAIQNESGLWEQIQFEGLRSILKRGGKSYVDIKHIEKELTGDYSKGTILPNGRVIPLVFPLQNESLIELI